MIVKDDVLLPTEEEPRGDKAALHGVEELTFRAVMVKSDLLCIAEVVPSKS